MIAPAVPDWLGVSASLALVVVTIALVWREQLHLAKDVAIAAIRAGVQLLLVGLVLNWLFQHAGIPGALAWLLAMVLIASDVAGRRGRGLPRARLVAGLSIAVATAATLGLLLAAQVVEVEPRVVVPVGGMVVSGAMQATSLILLRLRESVTDDRRRIEARLALGLSATDSFRPSLRSAMQAALAPNIDTTKVVGLISLPGAMTGLILAGVAPSVAIRYQIVVMYMLLASWTIAAMVAGQLMRRLVFDDAQRLVPIVTAKRATGRLAA